MTLKVKSKHDVDEPLDAFEEVEEVIEEIDDGEGDQTTAHHDTDVQIISEKVVSRIENYFLYANIYISIRNKGLLIYDEFDEIQNRRISIHQKKCQSPLARKRM